MRNEMRTVNGKGSKNAKHAAQVAARVALQATVLAATSLPPVPSKAPEYAHELTTLLRAHAAAYLRAGDRAAFAKTADIACTYYETMFGALD